MNEIKQNWNFILQRTRDDSEMSDIAYNTWLLPLEPKKLENDILYVLAPNELVIQYIERKLQIYLEIALAEQCNYHYNVKFVTPETLVSLRETKVSHPVHFSTLKYTFENFVVGDNNQFAHAASLAVAESPGCAYTPLYLHGGPGLGKTHLAQAIQHYIEQHDSTKKVIYVSSETFTNEVISTIRSGKATDLDNLREKYRTCDIFILDDIQFLIGKESTQQEFFHTFNELHAAGKQIVITSDRPPKELISLNERIVSRCEWGLMANIDAPDFTMRMKILRHIVLRQNAAISEEVLSYIAQHFNSNIRELEGAITRLLAFYKLTKTELTLETAEKELACYISPDTDDKITPELIMATVAEHFNVTETQLVSKGRAAKLVLPRHITMYLCRELTETTEKEIGKMLGGRDHSTVTHACTKIANTLVNDTQLASTIDVIKKKINSK